MRTGRSYQEAEVISSTSEQLVPLIYRELLKNLRRGVDQIQRGDLAAKADSFGKASAILLELMASLDMNQPGDLPKQLASLYSYFIKEIEAASRTLDVGRLGPTIDMIARLEEAWTQAAREVGQAGTSPPGGVAEVPAR